ncbi:MAG: tail fiber domain-containing protein [Caldilineaceae bacterium]|nr:tail fiber domain-containing protein [Caldilineaceae bacterium]
MHNSTHATAKQPGLLAAHSTVLPQADVPPRKAAYTKPVLTTYGSVSELTMSISGSNTDTNGGSLNVPSDPRVKDNITRIGQHSLGIGLYLFDYKPEFREQWGDGRQFGVMADEVEAVMPAAVTTHADGYKRVNYHLLGISQTRN